VKLKNENATKIKEVVHKEMFTYCAAHREHYREHLAAKKLI